MPLHIEREVGGSPVIGSGLRNGQNHSTYIKGVDIFIHSGRRKMTWTRPARRPNSRISNMLTVRSRQFRFTLEATFKAVAVLVLHEEGTIEMSGYCVTIANMGNCGAGPHLVETLLVGDVNVGGEKH